MENCQSNIAVSRQRGFTLIELMVTIAIASILMTIAVSNYSTLSKNTRVESAKEHIVSVLQQARLKALSSGVTQTVEVKPTVDSVVDWRGVEKSFSGDRINVQKYACGSCTATIPEPASEIINFNRRGTSNMKSIKVSSPGSTRQFIIMVNSITGRIDVRTSCSGGVCQ